MKKIIREYFMFLDANFVGFDYDDDKEVIVIENSLDLNHMSEWIYNYMKDNK